MHSACLSFQRHQSRGSRGFRQGYITGGGTYIGLHGGRVTRVLKDKVIVEEKMKNVMGKIFPNKQK